MAVEPNTDDVRIDAVAMFAAIGRHWLRIVVSTLVLLVLTYLILMFVPRMYESSASLLVEPRDVTFLRATNDVSVSGGAVEDSAIASQIELIQSRDALLRVIETANLRNQPELTGTSSGPVGLIKQLLGASTKVENIDEVILGNLKQRLTVVRERDSQLISVLFRSENPYLAAEIANAIAETHLNRRVDVLIGDTADATKWLGAEIEKLRERVSLAEAKVASYRVDNDLFTGSNNTTLLDQQLSDISGQIIQSQERKSTAVSRASVLRSLIKSGQSIEGVAAVRDSAAVQRLGDEKGRLQSERAQRLATLLPNHPEVLALTAQVVEIDREIIAEGRRVADALDAEARIEAGVEESLRDELIRLKLDVSGATRSGVDLNELEREAAAQRDLLETYLLRFRDASARTDSNSALPNIRIVGEAAPAVTPASPKVALILAAVLLLSVVGQCGQILFSELLSGRALVEDEQSRSHRDYWQAQNAATAQAAAQNQTPVPPVVEDERPSFVHEEDSAPVVKAEPVIAQKSHQPSHEQVAEQSQSPRPEVVQLSPQQPVQSQPRPQFVAATPQQSFEPAPEPQQDAYFSEEYSHQLAPVSALPVELQPLGDAVAAAQERVIFVSTLGSEPESRAVVDMIKTDAINRGVSVAVVDASSNRRSAELGVTDLCAGAASFGDVVYRARSGADARVPWGRQGRINPDSGLAPTLIEALSDVFELVIVSSGRPGVASNLPAFAGIEGYLLVAAPFYVDDANYAGLQSDAALLGFDRMQIVQLNEIGTRVA